MIKGDIESYPISRAVYDCSQSDSLARDHCAQGSHLEGGGSINRILKLSSSGKWSELASEIKDPVVRESLYLVIDDVIRHSANLGELHSMGNALPEVLSEKESHRSIAYAIKNQDIDILRVISPKASLLDSEISSRVADDYCRNRSLFSEKFIELLSCKMSWKVMFSLPSYSDLADLVKHGLEAGNASCIAIASSLMSDSEKAGVFGSNKSYAQIELLSKHMKLDEGVISKVSTEVKGKILSARLGI